MGILIILVVVALFFTFVYFKTKDSYQNEGWNIISILFLVISIAWIIIHTSIWINVPYSFDSWVIQRESFQNTLNESRENGREIEAAAIVRDVAEWNRSLAKEQYHNTLWVYDWSVDDRINDLEPIK